ncbi:WD40 repeat-like protein [Hesseltinella vesiculosa]|uniref:WD40 repeat-like protein n=1 Tax=Hesseltinella vesiculosa TaxID=101127 RepID=A0A1X2GB65_9FUNG|nr:WD40 repeat-like protein [Hesseltinella vesiculosa]
MSEEYRMKLRSATKCKHDDTLPWAGPDTANGSSLFDANNSSKEESSDDSDSTHFLHDSERPLTPDLTDNNSPIVTTDLTAFFPPSPYGRPRKPIQGDRFIPQRDPHLARDFQLMEPFPRTPKRKSTDQTDQQTEEEQRESRRMLYFYRAECLGDRYAADDYITSEPPLGMPSSTRPPLNSRTVRRFYQFSSPQSERRSYNNTQYTTRDPSPTSSHRFRTSPISEAGHRILSAHLRPQRHINQTAIKILDAPDLQDDFYLNLVDWGSNDLLAVGLGTCVYLWDANSSKVTKLCDLVTENITSVSWANESKFLAIGTNRARLMLWDVNTSERVRTWMNHEARIGALAWNSNILTSGGRDTRIFHHDVRAKDPYFRKMVGHSQEVCGLKWSPDGSQLASGGNDNHLVIWNSHQDLIAHKFNQHVAAVKAIAWSPFERGVLASGGGTADKTIKFWNTNRGSLLDSYDTGSQVCNLVWSKRSKEIVSSHGYASQQVGNSNQVVVWDTTTMSRVAVLAGHNSRVLYMALNENGSTVVTGAGDETLRFWDIFGSIEPPRKDIDRHSILR